MIPKLYIVIPCYNEEEVLAETIKRLTRKMDGLEQFREVNLFLRGIVPMIGFRTATVAHQDDDYHLDYTKELAKLIKKRGSRFSMAYTGYRPLKNGAAATDINCKIRALLRFPMKFRCFAGSRFCRKATLAFGNSICCPSVLYNKKLLGETLFTSDMEYNIDWDTFLKLAEYDALK